MKIDFDYIDIDITIQDTIQMGKTKISNINVEIDYDGRIYFYNNSIDHRKILLDINELNEVVRISKLFRDRRTAYLNKS